MIAKSYLLKNLEVIEKLFNSSTSTTKGLFYSKLAILELCGWIEESMDDIIIKCAHRNIKDKRYQKEVNEIVKRNYGFDYEKNFRSMLIQVIGRVGVCKLERRIDPVKFQVLQSTLSKLKTYRDSEAHTHIKGITKRLDAPSLTKANYLLVYDGLIEIDSKLRRIGF